MPVPPSDISPTCDWRFRATIERDALRHHRSACVGFCLGKLEPDWRRPRFEFALTVLVFKDVFASDLAARLPELARYLRAANATAKAFGRQVLGLWVAWDEVFGYGRRRRHTRCGSLIDTANELKLDFVVKIDDSGGESLFAAGIWFAPRFPHQSLPYLRAKTRSDAAIDNPRRIRADWNRRIKRIKKAQ